MQHPAEVCRQHGADVLVHRCLSCAPSAGHYVGIGVITRYRHRGVKLTIALIEGVCRNLATGIDVIAEEKM
jgi:hypothetical protein